MEVKDGWVCHWMKTVECILVPYSSEAVGWAIRLCEFSGQTY